MKQRTRTVRPNAAEVALGNVLEWGIQRWVAWSGRETRISEAPWLEGPIGKGGVAAGEPARWVSRARLHW